MECLFARPIAIPPVSELTEKADLVIVIRPSESRPIVHKPDDTSFGDRDMTLYQALETRCEVIANLKGAVPTKDIRLVHFAFKSVKAEFNGSLFMCFLENTPRLLTYPTDETHKLDTSLFTAYADSGTPEYLAFLRKMPDGRFAPVAGHYDAAGSFRLLSVPSGAQRYYSAEKYRKANKTQKHSTAEQGDAVQPATAVDSKPEGKEKAKRKSEDRSQ